MSVPVKRYLPDFHVGDRDATEQITVEMLLNHTCGIDGEYFPAGGPDAKTSSPASSDKAKSTRRAQRSRIATPAR